VGAGYLLWLARSLWSLRAERSEFRLEMVLLGTVFAIALGVSVLGLAQASLPDKLFFSLYASAIGLAFLLVQIALNVRPQLSAEVQETALASAAYTSSTLVNVDSDAVLNRLTTFMQTEKLYIEPDLTLPLLAERLELRPHQLSELINTQLGKGFSRYLREQRVAAAATMLCAEPSASVLSVGMSVGFSSQSNFYQAFREIEGMTPGQYRKLHS
jgi:AraC-like DNA-binding protein